MVCSRLLGEGWRRREGSWVEGWLGVEDGEEKGLDGCLRGVVEWVDEWFVRLLEKGWSRRESG